jgi:hypothetical protein
MVTVAIITRRLKEGRTYEDFRKAWYHTVGFGTPSRLCTMINASDPREITVMGFVETNPGGFEAEADIDVSQRLANPLDDVIEPDIDRRFGILVSEDDFSAEGSIEYKPPSIAGKETDLKEFMDQLQHVAGVIAAAAKKRDAAKEARSSFESR